MLLKDSSLLEGRAFINGEWINADSGETTPVTNPATGEVIADTAKCGTAETRRAIEAAEAALPGFVREPKEYPNANLAPYGSCLFYAPAMFSGGTH